jgi:tetratricopeptide (TPR) repeat protein
MVLVVVIVFSSLLFIIPFSTLVHEAGHAVAMAVLTKEPVTIFLGSYGDRTKCVPVRLGKFEIWIQKNPLKWKGGLCMPGTTNVSTRKQIWYVLAGPFATLLLFGALLATFLVLRPGGTTGAFLALFCLYNGVSFLHNIVPRDIAIGLKRGELTYNDGYKLKTLLAHRRMPPKYFDAIQQYEERHYETAARLFEELIDGRIKNEEVYRMAIECCIEIKAYVRANAIQRAQIDRFGGVNMHDRIHMAAIKIGLGKYDEAIGYLKHLLELHGPNKYNLNNLGYALTLVGQYEAAIPYLNKAITIDDKFAFAYCNRGFAYLQSGQISEGKADTDNSILLDPDNAHAYRNNGLYHLHMGNYSDALEALEKARTMDADIPGLNKHLADARNKQV